MLLGLLLTLNIMICLALIAVVLLQRSEGGAFGSGSPTGLITTRGAGDLLTKTTWVLFSLFLTISLALTLLGGRERSSQAILNRLKLQSVNPASLAAPRPPPAANPAPLAPPAPAPVPAAPAKASSAANFAAPRPKVRLEPAAPIAPPPAESPSGSPPPSPSVPKLLAPMPTPGPTPPGNPPPG